MAPTDPYVLVVDDDPLLRRVLQAVLENNGWMVEAVADGSQAVECAQRHPPSVVVLDWDLPGLEGDKIAARLRLEHGDGLPIMLLTAQAGLVEKARKIGAFAAMSKPFDVEALVRAVRRAFERSGSEPRPGPTRPNPRGGAPDSS